MVIKSFDVKDAKAKKQEEDIFSLVVFLSFKAYFFIRKLV
jgi:hypothetical protein